MQHFSGQKKLVCPPGEHRAGREIYRMENSVSSAALNAAREQLDAAEAAREVILLQHIANGVVIDSRTVQIAPDVVIAPGAVILAGTILRGRTVIGAGCIIGPNTLIEDCNYDGKDKFRTQIGDYCFIGCNTNLVAPVKVGDGAYTAAGSTITKDVPAQALGIARERQTNLDGWAEPKMEAYIAKKQKLENEQNK